MSSRDNWQCKETHTWELWGVLMDVLMVVVMVVVMVRGDGWVKDCYGAF